MLIGILGAALSLLIRHGIDLPEIDVNMLNFYTDGEIKSWLLFKRRSILEVLKINKEQCLKNN